MAPEGQCQWNMAKTYQRIIYAYVYRYIKWMYSKIEVTSPKALSVSLGAHHHISNGSFESMLLCARECVSLYVCVFLFVYVWDIMISLFHETVFFSRVCEDKSQKSEAVNRHKHKQYSDLVSTTKKDQQISSMRMKTTAFNVLILYMCVHMICIDSKNATHA